MTDTDQYFFLNRRKVKYVGKNYMISTIESFKK